jgi:hypothetical protein
MNDRCAATKILIGAIGNGNRLFHLIIRMAECHRQDSQGRIHITLEIYHLDHQPTGESTCPCSIIMSNSIQQSRSALPIGQGDEYFRLSCDYRC